MQWGIRGRLLFAALFPASVLTATMLLLFAHARLEGFDYALRHEARSLAREWMPEIGSALGRDDLQALQGLAATMTQNRNVARIRILDWRGEVVLDTGSVPEDGPMADLGSRLLYMASDFRRDEPHASIELLSSPPAPMVRQSAGTLELRLSSAHALQRFLGAMAIPVVLALGLLAITLLLALATTASVTSPLRRLIRHARRLEQGDLEAQVRTGSGGEMGELERAMNSMAMSLREGRQELQQQVRHTTSELRQTLQAVEVQNVELDVARKRALEASKVKSEFLANVSHEIRTPINGIVGFADLLQHSPLDAEQRDYVSTIKESCSNLLAIVNDILDFSKIEAGKLAIDNVAFDLRDSVEEVLSLLAPTAYSKSLELTHLIYADVPLKLHGDPIRVRQILTNLVHNAIKFTPAGRVVVRVMLEEDSEAEAVLRITVTDTGIGLSKEDQSKLFKAFSQADTSLTRRFGGTGLGLIISKKLLEQMGGTIGLDSEPDKGSTFWFTLRCQKQRGAQRGDVASWHNPLAGKRVLLFDQEPLSRLATRHLLESWDIALNEAEDQQTLSSLASAGGRWDMVVIGLARTELKGPLCQSQIPRIRTLGIPLLVMASTVDRDELQALYQLGVDTCLPKAVRHQTVFRELCRLIAPESTPLSLAPPDETLADGDRDRRPETRVLVVDDNEINRKLVTTIAARHGASVHEATDGRQAVEACRRESYDIIFMDIHMPGMSGEAAAREIRRMASEGRQPRILALTANALPGERERLLQAGMEECLIKPVTEEEVSKALSGTKKTGPVPSEGEHGDQGGPDDGQLRREMQRMLIAELPEHRRAIRDAYRRNRLEELRERVHKLHGAVSVCQIPALRDACQDLENAIVQDDRPAVPGGFERLMQEIGNLLDGEAPQRRTMA